MLLSYVDKGRLGWFSPPHISLNFQHVLTLERPMFWNVEMGTFAMLKKSLKGGGVVAAAKIYIIITMGLGNAHKDTLCAQVRFTITIPYYAYPATVHIPCELARQWPSTLKSPQ